MFGTGYTQARGLVQGTGVVPDGFGPLEFLATTTSSLSGFPEGIFAPSLAVGTGLGNSVAAILPGAPGQTPILLGMVPYFAGVVRAPITTFVIVTEMTNDHALVVPLMLASVIGFTTSKSVCPERVYHALAHDFGTANAATHRTAS